MLRSGHRKDPAETSRADWPRLPAAEASPAGLPPAVLPPRQPARSYGVESNLRNAGAGTAVAVKSLNKSFLCPISLHQ